jgi:EAL domain-containing protein (putative c-di-GMP-specific phosphodiesterase class I)
MTGFDDKSLLQAARAAVWQWSKASGILTIQAELQSPLHHLDGSWSLDGFADQVDGMTRSSFLKTMQNAPNHSAIDETLTLRDGESVRFVGSSIGESSARGLIFTETTAPAYAATDIEGLEPVYQPIWNVKDKKLAGFEALARWRTPEGELVGPDELHSYSLNADWSHVAPAMLSFAAKALVRFRKIYPDLFIQVNLSAGEIAKSALVREVEDLLRTQDLPRGVLRIELTEHAALRDVNRALGAFAAFRAAGAGLILDDFGAGHSSLLWLAEIPADGLKLDQRLTSMISRPRGKTIIGAIVELAHKLGMTVTAEGVESEDMSQAVADIGCDFVQGYLSGSPMCEDEILEHMRAKTSAFSEG